MSPSHLFSQRLCSLSIVLKHSPDMFARETDELVRVGLSFLDGRKVTAALVEPIGFAAIRVQFVWVGLGT